MPKYDRNANGNEHIAASGRAGDALQRAHGGIRQSGAQHEIAAGVANDSQFRQHQHFDSVCFCAANQRDDGIRIVFAVGNLNLRCA
ncbi:hypothetical protein SDC9_116691 [bioreactor metagenome]|uniref:Uncharacterized protein n=1 Tax=bioreactor metagenome TaxID=1076179 RepID=A0A645C326_9ZZZZ